jgi:hypothetical protein
MKPALGTTIRDLFERSDAEDDNLKKGRLLEDLICCLFEAIPGINITVRNELDAFRAGEIDIAFFNDKHPEGLFFIEHVVLVECKNWSKPVGSDELRIFDDKLEERGLTTGILIAVNGITGDAKLLSSAHHHVSTALREGRRIVVITREEIEAIGHTYEIVDLLKRKLLRLHAKRTSLA